MNKAKLFISIAKDAGMIHVEVEKIFNVTHQRNYQKFEKRRQNSIDRAW